MDLILLVCIINGIVLSFLYVRFIRFTRIMKKEEDRILHRTKKQAEMIVDTADKQEGSLERSLAESRKKMTEVFEEQVEKDAKKIEKELDSRLSAYTQSVFTRVDAHIAQSLTRIDTELAAYKNQKIERLDEKVNEQIKKAAKTALVRGLPLSVHEKIVDKAIKEALSEING